MLNDDIVFLNLTPEQERTVTAWKQYRLKYSDFLIPAHLTEQACECGTADEVRRAMPQIPTRHFIESGPVEPGDWRGTSDHSQTGYSEGATDARPA